MTRQERERVVLDLYHNQGKTVRDIAKEARISFRYIGAILNNAIEQILYAKAVLNSLLP